MNAVRILIVEDELIIAEDMMMKLESMGYQVVGSALDYDEAIELLASESPDIALLDINLGESKSGIDVAAHIRKQYNIPIVFITSNTTPETIQEVAAVKPNGFLVKPYKKEELFASIEVAMSNYLSSNAQAVREVFKDTLFIRDQHIYLKLRHEDIQWLKAEGNYTMIYTAAKKHLVRGKLKELQAMLPPTFFRLHKSYMVNLHLVESVQPTVVTVAGQEVPLGKMYREELMGHLNTL